MKQGKYVTIPEKPFDLEQLWHSGERIKDEALPDWLGPDEAPQYRHLGCASWRGGPAPADYLAERDALKHAGIIVDEGSPQHPVDHFYMMDPQHEWYNEALWAIGIYSGADPFHLSPAPGAANPVITRDSVTDVPAAFVADPFILRAQNRWHMFFEVMNWQTGRGDIGLAFSDDALRWDYQQIVLTGPFHLSYPHVFQWKGDYYMIPETHQAGAVRLYRGDPFPTRWTLVRELIRGPYLADSSIFRHEGIWYLFADTSLDLANDTLSLYWSDDLMGPWALHPMSPIVTMNPRTARPGGKVIHVNGRPFRYTQGCEPYYGTDVSVFEITELTPTRYSERSFVPSPILGPTGHAWNACGMHHVDAHQVGGAWIASVDGWRSETLLKQGYPGKPAGSP